MHLRLIALFLLIMTLLVACSPGEAPPPAATEPAVAEPEPTEQLPSPTPQIEEEATNTPPAATDTPEQPTATATSPPTEAAPTLAPEQQAAEEALITEEEAILILEPGPGSRVTSPLRITGEADPTFEQNLVARIVDLEGQELTLAPTIIDAELGQRGPFEFELPFEIEEEQQAFIQVYATSARDGGITHLASMGVTLAPSGEEEIVPVTPHPERIVIDEPAMADTISGGVVTVSGRGLASFEQTLIVELLDAEGEVIDSQPIIVDAPDLGQPGEFSAELSYSIEETTPARVLVRDPSPAFGGHVHLASVEVTLEAE
ncbi:MAG TPA: Gmad2 immunoglobulin-like domain-containing protein [Candidatus Sulfomarinibacteraceae bacterium]|nr:Gmad2 immunoglobulin-like domain-containing protein [Candidatus Sulfomarinibacteraceae bacterium]